MPETSREYAAHELEAMGYVVRVLEQFCRVAADVEREGGSLIRPMLSRTDDEIVARIAALQPVSAGDVLGIEKADLLCYLPFEAVDWGLAHDRSPEAVKTQIREYLTFAWDKANHCRGLSAMRSLSHMRAWLWMLGDKIFAVFAPHLDDYDCYGKHQLVAISEFVGFNWRAQDNGHWCNEENGPHLGIKDDVGWIGAAREAPDA